MRATPAALLILFGQLSLLAFGGGNTVLPEMQRQVVAVHHWATAPEFGALFALAQAAPGPNLMIVVLVGWHLAGLAGALASAAAMFGPSGLLTMLVVGQWRRFHHRRWHGVLRTAVFPVTVGLLAASAGIIGWSVAVSPVTVAIMTGSCAVLVARRAGPLPVLVAGACLGMLVDA